MATPSVAIIGTRGYPSYYGGFETLVRRLSPYLADHGWDVCVYGRPGAVVDDSAEYDPRVKSLMSRGIERQSLSTLTYGMTATLNTAKRRPDVALVMNVANGFWLPALRRKAIPTVVNVDGLEWEREKWGANAKRAFRAGAKLTARYADQLVTDSREIQKTWLADFDRTSEFIPYGGDILPKNEPVDGLPGGGYILMVARFVPENTIEPFLDAAKKLSASWPVVLVGSSGYGGPIEDRVRELAASNPKIHWFGHISDDVRLFSLWQNAGVYFHGHSVGGTNPALVQAMACGSPIVARDTKYNREVLGDFGIFTQPTPESIEEAIAGAMHDSFDNLGAGANLQERAAEHYSWDGVCMRYESVLEAVSRRSGGLHSVDM